MFSRPVLTILFCDRRDSSAPTGATGGMGLTLTPLSAWASHMRRVCAASPTFNVIYKKCEICSRRNLFSCEIQRDREREREREPI
jgi:hypothetical protein